MSGYYELSKVGREHYRKACGDPHLPPAPIVARGYLNKAIAAYTQASEAARQAGGAALWRDAASTEYNLGAAHSKLADLAGTDAPMEAEMRSRSVVHFLHAVFLRAQSGDTDDTDVKWYDKLRTRALESVAGSVAAIACAKDREAKLSSMYKLINSIEALGVPLRGSPIPRGIFDEALFQLRYETAQMRFHMAVLAAENDDELPAVIAHLHACRELLFVDAPPSIEAELKRDTLAASEEKHSLIAKCKSVRAPPRPLHASASSDCRGR